MTRLIALFIVQDKRDNKLKYVPLEMLTEKIPMNKSDNIIELVNAANIDELNSDLLYVDVAGIHIDGKTERWEEGIL